jgi:cytochrome c oxidase subunit 4
MAERILSPSTYIIVCIVMVVLTAVSLAISFIPLAGQWHLIIGVAIGLCKATLVVLFFMHALISSRLTWLVIAISVFWLGILLVLTLGDYFTRGLIPFTPGH